jgi:hypothetical protein
MARKKNPVLDALKKASRGLLYVSETESKLHPFVWENAGELDEKSILTAGEYEYDERTPVERATLEDFLRVVPEEEREGFDRLAGVLREQLTDLRVYKLGKTQKDVYVVGKTPAGQWAGVWGSVVET